ncbi:mannitol-1-phosphate 5-dehydrogenase [Atractiella rhizophila]|nr:mannitol-1-phosphate 5-dehydrogenase [Atractiella rhizophila]
MASNGIHNDKIAVHFGAGNIGRGFIGPLLSSSGYHVTFVDVAEPLIDALNEQDWYRVELLATAPIEDKVFDFSGLLTSDPSVLEEIAKADIITTSVGPEILCKVAPTIANGLKRRFEKKVEKEATVIACENMVFGTRELEKLVFAHLEEDKLKEYVKNKIGFASCEVDRIVPPTSSSRKSSDEHVDDKLVVEVEKFYEWIVEKNKIKGRVHVEGMNVQDDIEPYLERKLFTLNCGHAILAYVGHIKGYHDTQHSISDSSIRSLVEAAITESGEGLKAKHKFSADEHASYIRLTLKRFANPHIDDDLSRVGRKPIRKLSPNERLVGAANMCIERGLGVDHLLKGIAAAYLFDVEGDDDATKLLEMVKKDGIESAVENTTQWKKGSKENRKVCEAYEEWKKAKKTTN